MRFGLPLLLLAAASPPPDRASVATIVEALGTGPARAGDEEALAAHRCVALPLLASALASLPPVPPGKVGGALGRPATPLSDRTDALLRALRTLTGHDEYGPISRRDYRALPAYREAPGGDGILKRDSLVSGLPPGQSRYSAYWMSRGTSFYAPVATQRAIKAGWLKTVRNFDCRPSARP